MSGRAQLIQRSRQVKRRRKLFQLAGLLFLMLITVVLSIYTLHRPRWRIEKIEVIGLKTINRDDVAQVVDRELTQSYFWLIPRDSRLFLPMESLTIKLKNSFPRIAEVKLARIGTSLRVEVVERESEFLWCLVGGVNKKDCYFVDLSGLAFAKAPNFSDHVLFEIDRLVSPSAVATTSFIGGVVLAPAEINKIYEHKKAIDRVLTNHQVFDRSIITLAELATTDGYIFQVSSPVLAEDPWRLQTSSKMSGEGLITVLDTLFGSDSFDKNVVKPRQPLSYIDARFSNKVFFKVLDHHATSTP